MKANVEELRARIDCLLKNIKYLKQQVRDYEQVKSIIRVLESLNLATNK